ncbi:unnamed protein product [Gordionus sp. m RMFG-2023]
MKKELIVIWSTVNTPPHPNKINGLAPQNGKRPEIESLTDADGALFDLDDMVLDVMDDNDHVFVTFTTQPETRDSSSKITANQNEGSSANVVKNTFNKNNPFFSEFFDESSSSTFSSFSSSFRSATNDQSLRPKIDHQSIIQIPIIDNQPINGALLPHPVTNHVDANRIDNRSIIRVATPLPIINNNADHHIDRKSIMDNQTLFDDDLDYLYSQVVKRKSPLAMNHVEQGETASFLLPQKVGETPDSLYPRIEGKGAEDEAEMIYAFPSYVSEIEIKDDTDTLSSSTNKAPTMGKRSSSTFILSARRSSRHFHPNFYENLFDLCSNNGGSVYQNSSYDNLSLNNQCEYYQNDPLTVTIQNTDTRSNGGRHLGIHVIPPPSFRTKVGIGGGGGGGLMIHKIENGGLVYRDEIPIKIGDVISAINGASLEGKSFKECLGIFKEGISSGQITLEYRRRERRILSPDIVDSKYSTNAEDHCTGTLTCPPYKNDDIKEIPLEDDPKAEVNQDKRSHKNGSQMSLLAFRIPLFHQSPLNGNTQFFNSLGVSVKGKTAILRQQQSKNPETKNHKIGGNDEGKLLQERDLGIFVKSVILNGAAYYDNRLKAEDRIVSVNGEGLIGLSNVEAMHRLTATMKMAAHHESFPDAPPIKYRMVDVRVFRKTGVDVNCLKREDPADVKALTPPDINGENDSKDNDSSDETAVNHTASTNQKLRRTKLCNESFRAAIDLNFDINKFRACQEGKASSLPIADKIPNPADSIFSSNVKDKRFELKNAQINSPLWPTTNRPTLPSIYTGLRGDKWRSETRINKTNIVKKSNSKFSFKSIGSVLKKIKVDNNADKKCGESERSKNSILFIRKKALAHSIESVHFDDKIFPGTKSYPVSTESRLRDDISKTNNNGNLMCERKRRPYSSYYPKELNLDNINLSNQNDKRPPNVEKFRENMYENIVPAEKIS